MDYLQEAVRNYVPNEDGLRNLNGAKIAAMIAQAEALQSIAVSLAALVELSGGRNMVDIHVGDGDFTDGLDDEGELPF